MSDFQQQQNHKACKEIEECGPVKGKNKQELSWKRTDGNLLDKDFKTIILKVTKKLKKDMEKIIYKQNGNVNKGIKINLSFFYSGAEKYNKWNY